MKVLLVNKFHYRKGGSETYYFTLADALKQAGHEVVFFAMEDKEKNLPCEQEKYFVSHASVKGSIKSRINMVLHIANSRESYQKMSQLLRAEKPDLVILNLVHRQITLSILDAIHEFDPKLPVFWTMHDLIVVCPGDGMLNGKGQICEKCLSGNFTHCVKNKCIKGSALMSILALYEANYIRKKKWYDKVDLFICPSEFHRGKLEEGKFTKSPIVTLRNPLPLDTVFEAQGLDEGYMLYFGRLAADKGVSTLIEAAKICHCRLVILGTGPQEEALKAQAEGYSNIEFKGFQTGETLKNYIRKSRCVVMSSACYENGPYSAMESMAMGKPLIVPGLGGLPELVEDGVNGFIFGTTAEELASCIEKMQKLDEDAYRIMCDNALEKAQSAFNAVHYVKALEQQYRAIKETK